MCHLISCGVIMLLLALPGSGYAQNSIIAPWNTPFGVPPFAQVREADYRPAFDAAMKLHRDEVQAISSNPEPATFANTVEALERSGAMLTRVSNLFFAMNSSMTNDAMQEITRTIAPALSAHRDEILLNDQLFQRIKTVYDKRAETPLTPEQQMLLTKAYRRFTRGGALLKPAQKEQLKKLNEELSVLTVKFGEHTLAENSRFTLIVENKADLAGLPDGVVAAAAEAAKERGHEGTWVFTLHKPSLIPFLQFAGNRKLREKMYRAYINRGNNNDSLDNKDILARVVTLRQQRAQLLGYPTHARYVLEENMARNPENVYDLLKRLWTPAVQRARTEAADMQKLLERDQPGTKLEGWDWWYYAEKVKREKYDLDETTLRPYFELSHVRQAAFDLATRLFGITFVERPDIAGYHPDVRVFEVKERTGEHVGVLFVDYYPRPSKEGGAWMGNFRDESKRDGKRIAPVIFNVGNFTKPTGDTPSLLSVDEVETLFHEFGHALHGLLTDCTYESLSGTNVATDFVELPSQIMENWAFEPELLRTYARHYKTGEVIPADLVEKLRRSKTFNQGFATVEYLAASILDMDWHEMVPQGAVDVIAFERAAMDKIHLPGEIAPRYSSWYFNHIFSGGYSAGYYSYVWAEVLDADAFQAFKETGNIFDLKTAQSYRDNILARGGTEEGMVLYRTFRGKDPGIEPLLQRRGLTGKE
jgi:peptidyl-dipeptidase Dcp